MSKFNSVLAKFAVLVVVLALVIAPAIRFAKADCDPNDPNGECFGMIDCNLHPSDPACAPLKCLDTSANNFLQPLPCTYNPSPGDGGCNPSNPAYPNCGNPGHGDDTPPGWDPIVWQFYCFINPNCRSSPIPDWGPSI